MKNRTKEHFIPFDKLFYLQKSGEFQNDSLFRQVAAELGLNSIFEYQMSFFQNQDDYHVFLTHVDNLGKNEFCYPQPLIFGALFDEKLIKQKNFAVLVFDKKFAFLSFYKNGKLNSVRNLPQFSLSDIYEKNEGERESYFLQMLFEQGRILQLFEHNKSEILISFCDEFNFGEFFKQKTLKTHVKLESFLGENALQNLSKLSHKRLDINANFIKEEKTRMKPYVNFMVLFLVFYFGAFIFSMFLHHRQNQTIKQNNENIENELKTLDLELKLLNEELKNLDSTLNQNNTLLTVKEKALQDLSENFYPDKNRIAILTQVIEILNQSAIKISTLSLEDTKLKLVFNNRENLDKAVNSFGNQVRFKILEKDEKNHYLSLGYKDE